MWQRSSGKLVDPSILLRRKEQGVSTLINPAGVDGCRGGWVVASGPPERPRFTIHGTFQQVLALGHRPLAVDMPIGLPTLGRKRTCDQVARRHLGRRACCVFSAPPRELLTAKDYDSVRKHGLTLQAFHLIPKIREVDRLIDAKQQAWLRETHPELVFWRLNGSQPLKSKKTREGLEHRLQLLTLKSLRSFARKLCAPDDLIDAAALLRAATDWGSDPPTRLIHAEEFDCKGLRMEICF